MLPWLDHSLTSRRSLVVLRHIRYGLLLLLAGCLGLFDLFKDLVLHLLSFGDRVLSLGLWLWLLLHLLLLIEAIPEEN